MREGSPGALGTSSPGEAGTERKGLGARTYRGRVPPGAAALAGRGFPRRAPTAAAVAVRARGRRTRGRCHWRPRTPPPRHAHARPGPEGTTEGTGHASLGRGVAGARWTTGDLRGVGHEASRRPRDRGKLNSDESAAAQSPRKALQSVLCLDGSRALGEAHLRGRTAALKRSVAPCDGPQEATIHGSQSNGVLVSRDLQEKHGDAGVRSHVARLQRWTAVHRKGKV